ncbi:MAG: hypothetical protein HY735_14740, partial [Verrucomicrobia bacterium]|nr:hypothetical protein [Verrucomicrobiota bacterium]
MLIGLGVFALTVTLFYAEENWRGKRAWHKYKLRLEAKGKSLDWTAYIPPLVPDDQNIFKAPRMEGFKKGNGTNEFLTVRAGPSHELVVAKLVVVVPGRTSEPAVADFHDAASPAEALAEIERLAGRRALAAQGIITLVADDVGQMTPV